MNGIAQLVPILFYFTPLRSPHPTSLPQSVDPKFLAFLCLWYQNVKPLLNNFPHIDHIGTPPLFTMLPAQNIYSVPL